MRTILIAILLFLPSAVHANEPFLLKDAQRVAFLGDSNTYAGKFIAYLDAYICTRFPDKRIELINLGLPSETVSGLSEADHPYPRPNIHDRVDRALELSKPDVVIICYGMNDGIYSPFSEERFKKYQTGLLTLIAKVEKAGAEAILMTPAPFDPTPLKAKLLPKDAPKFSWLKPYERYDEEVLTKYSEWLLTLRDKKYTVIDAHAALLKHLARMRDGDVNYRVSGDGIHPNANGHLVIALEILKELKAPNAVRALAIDVAKELQRADTDPPNDPDLRFSHLKPNAVIFSFFLPLPMPADPAWTARAKEIENFDGKVNRYSLKVESLGGALRMQAKVGKDSRKRVPIRADEISKGIDMTPVLDLPPDTKTPAVWKLIDEKNRLLGQAWLTHVGHKRPDTPKGMPFDDAQKKAATLNLQIRALCEPAAVSMVVGPLGKPAPKKPQ